jgi:hypothetical protein
MHSISDDPGHDIVLVRLHQLAARGYVPALGLGRPSVVLDSIFLDHPRRAEAPSLILYPDGLVVEARPHPGQMRFEPSQKNEFIGFLKTVPRPNVFQSAMAMTVGQAAMAIIPPAIFLGVIIATSKFLN